MLSFSRFSQYLTGELNDGAMELRYGVGELRYGAGELMYGAGELRYGAGELRYGVGELRCGAGELKWCAIPTAIIVDPLVAEPVLSLPKDARNLR